MKLQERFHARAALVAQMRAILDRVEPSSRQLTADENQSYTSMEEELAALNSIIAKEQRLEAQQNLLNNEREHPIARGGPTLPGHPKGEGSFYGRAFAEYARKGRDKVSSEIRNALQVGTNSEGGYIVPSEYETAIVAYLQQLNPIRARATVVPTASDRPIPIETDRGDFAYISEEGSFTQDDPIFGRVLLGAYKMGGIIRVSEELLQDALFDVGSYLTEAAGRRFAALEGSSFTTGDGSGVPTGLFETTAVAGVDLTGHQGAVSAVATITSDDIIETYHTLGIPYRMNAVWIGGSDITKMIRKLKDSTNQYIWEPGLKAGMPSTLLGRPYLEMEDAPAPAVEGKSILFGDLSRYYIADRLGIVAQRLDELYAATGQVGFRFARRIDAQLVDPRGFVYFQHGAGA